MAHAGAGAGRGGMAVSRGQVQLLEALLERFGDAASIQMVPGSIGRTMRATVRRRGGRALTVSVSWYGDVLEIERGR